MNNTIQMDLIFRGKDIRTGKWEYGDYYKQKTISGPISHVITSFAFVAPVPLESVGLFTGMCDKNGNRIFTGDVLQDGRYKYLVKFGQFDNKLGYDMQSDGVGFYTSEVYLSYKADFEHHNSININLSLSEIIGNVYDNPELMEIFKE